MSSAFGGQRPGPAGPASDIVPVTPSDSTDLAPWAASLYVEGAGNVVIVTHAGATRTVAVAANSILPVAVRRVRATGTTATGIHALTIV